jgi:hypothetical protein
MRSASVVDSKSIPWTYKPTSSTSKTPCSITPLIVSIPLPQVLRLASVVDSKCTPWTYKSTRWNYISTPSTSKTPYPLIPLDVSIPLPQILRLASVVDSKSTPLTYKSTPSTSNPPCSLRPLDVSSASHAVGIYGRQQIHTLDIQIHTLDHQNPLFPNTPGRIFRRSCRLASVVHSKSTPWTYKSTPSTSKLPCSLTPLDASSADLAVGICGGQQIHTLDLQIHTLDQQNPLSHNTPGRVSRRSCGWCR